jgi:hypothetical protein
MWPVSLSQFFQLVLAKMHCDGFLGLVSRFVTASFHFHELEANSFDLGTLNLVVCTSDPPVWDVLDGTGISHVPVYVTP